MEGMACKIRWNNAAINALSVCHEAWLFSSVYWDDVFALKMLREAELVIPPTS